MNLRLTTKFTLIISAVLVTVMILFTYFSVSSLEKIFLKEAVKDIDNLSETILSTTYHQMLLDHRDRVYQSISEVGTQQGVKSIRLINKDGEIRYSTLPQEIGTAIDKSGPACVMCHGEHYTAPLVSASSMRRSRRFFDASGEEVMAMTRGIYNQPKCSTASCHEHAPGIQLLGVLDVSVSLKEMRTLIREFKGQVILSTFGLLFTLALSLAFVTGRYIHRPVRELLEHTRRLARGDLKGRIEAPARDELGELEEAFNDMTSNLQQAQGELTDLASSLETKVEERTRQIQEMQNHLLRSGKLASLGELVAGIAHEINNPLTGIMVFSNLLLADSRLHQGLRNDLEIIRRETERCSGIVRRLLAFSRESTPQKALESVHVLLENTLSLLEKQPTFRTIELTREYAADLPEVPVDANQISQVLMNILLNALQAMPEGGILKVSTARFDDENIVVQVADSGGGISKENLERIFDPFFTTKEMGTGLGLSVSYGIIENHGGRIEAESPAGGGTVFSIYLPLGETTAEVPGAPED